MQENDQALAEYVVRLAREAGADEAEALIIAGNEFSVTVRKGTVEKLIEASTRALGLRLLKSNCSSTSYSADLTSAALRRFVDRAIELAAIADADPAAGLPDWEEHHASPPLDLYDPSIEALSAEQKIEWATRCEQSAFDHDPRVTNSDGGSFGSSVNLVTLVNSRGFAGSYQTSSASLSVEVMADDADGKKRNDYWYSAERFLDRMETPEEVGRKAALRALRKLGARKVPTQTVPIVFDQQAARGLGRVIAGAVNGSALEHRSSFLVGREGELVASPLLTIIDDGLLPGRLGSRPFDGEGVATRVNLVIREGTFQTFLFDTYTARKTGHISTGNCTRSVGSPPSPGSSNFYVAAGETDPEEIIASVDNGLYLTDMMGFGVNLTTGDFSRGAAGLWIENGRLTYPVSEITISGNLRQMLQEIEMVGSDIDWRGSLAAPTLKLRSMTVSGL